MLGGVEAAISSLLASTGTSSSGAACAGRSRGLGVLGSGTIAGAFASRTSTARAAGSGDGVLGWGLVAGAVESRLLSARALSLLSTNTFGTLAAAGGSLVSSHC